MRALLGWLKQVVAGQSGPSTGRVAFLFYVVMGAAWLSYDLVLSLASLKKSGITAEWVMAFGIYSSTATAAFLGSKAIGGKYGSAGNGAPGPRASGTMEAPPS